MLSALLERSVLGALRRGCAQCSVRKEPVGTLESILIITCYPAHERCRYSVAKGNRG